MTTHPTSPCPHCGLARDAVPVGECKGVVDHEDEWRCFHCDEVFTDHIAAATHFGGHVLSLAACQIKAEEGGLVELIRKQEAELDRHRSEDTASYREFYSLGADHTRALMRVEEEGYAKGLADGRKESALAANAAEIATLQARVAALTTPAVEGDAAAAPEVTEEMVNAAYDAYVEAGDKPWFGPDGVLADVIRAALASVSAPPYDDPVAWLNAAPAEVAPGLRKAYEFYQQNKGASVSAPPGWVMVPEIGFAQLRGCLTAARDILRSQGKATHTIDVALAATDDSMIAAAVKP